MANIHDIYQIFMNRFRPRRAKDIGKRFPVIFDPSAKVLDVGGGVFPWDILDPKAHVIVLNISRPHTLPMDSKLEFVVGDGTQLEYPDQSFDLVFSNSVIEHVGDIERQHRFAREMLRVGKSIYCQTPNKWFPVEPHLIALFIHWLPFSILRHLTRYFTVWGLITKPDQSKIDEFLRSTKLLSIKDVKALFPNCIIRHERVLGMSKSFIVQKEPG